MNSVLAVLQWSSQK